MAVHLDTQFRLLREDMLAELRNDLQATQESKGKRPRGLVTQDLRLEGIDCGSQNRRRPVGLVFRCLADPPPLRKSKGKERESIVKDSKSILKNQSIGCLLSDKGILAFAMVYRDESYLIQFPPAIVLQVSDRSALQRVLIAVKSSQTLQFVQVDTPFFAYQPILKQLQRKSKLPLSEELIHLEQSDHWSGNAFRMADVIRDLEINEGRLQDLLQTPKTITLDKSQALSLKAGFTKNVSLIQGPPGESHIRFPPFARLNSPSQVLANLLLVRYWQRAFTTRRWIRSL